MVARNSRAFLVPSTLLVGASCLLSSRPHFRTASSDGDARSRGLTPAESRVLEFVLAGLSNKEIASELNRAEPTIKNQVASILRKHGVPSRARLMALLR